MKSLLFIGVVLMLLMAPVASLSQGLDDVIVIQNKDYYAEISPAFGGNCIRLKHLPSGIEVLRTPTSNEEFEASPELFGMPILFFPNRIQGGRFTFEGRTYTWPINEPERNGFVHGTLFHTPFQVVERCDSGVTLEFEATKQKPYLDFPHAFSLQLRYWLDAGGLHQQVRVHNSSDLNMPFGIAFHTTFNLPLLPEGSVEATRLLLPVDQLYPRDQKTLTPTGEVLHSFALRRQLRSGTLVPARHELSDFYSGAGGPMQLRDPESGWQVNYTGDSTHKFWMLWNGGRSDLLVVEPQTCMIDVFNVDLPGVDQGAIIIKPGEVFKNQTSLEVVRSKSTLPQTPHK